MEGERDLIRRGFGARIFRRKGASPDDGPARSGQEHSCLHLELEETERDRYADHARGDALQKHHQVDRLQTWYYDRDRLVIPNAHGAWVSACAVRDFRPSSHVRR